MFLIYYLENNADMLFAAFGLVSFFLLIFICSFECFVTSKFYLRRCKKIFLNKIKQKYDLYSDNYYEESSECAYFLEKLADFLNIRSKKLDPNDSIFKVIDINPLIFENNLDYESPSSICDKNNYSFFVPITDSYIIFEIMELINTISVNEMPDYKLCFIKKHGTILSFYQVFSMKIVDLCYFLKTGIRCDLLYHVANNYNETKLPKELLVKLERTLGFSLTNYDSNKSLLSGIYLNTREKDEMSSKRRIPYFWETFNNVDFLLYDEFKKSQNYEDLFYLLMFNEDDLIPVLFLLSLDFKYFCEVSSKLYYDNKKQCTN